MKQIGITTTVPVEILLAAGYTPVDLNNILVSAPNPTRYIIIAERAGFPLNCCAWIKGLYGICLDKGFKDVLCVTSGDCSNTIMLMEVLRLKGINAMPFAYPDKPDNVPMQAALEKLAESLGTTLSAAEKIRKELEPARSLAMELDNLTWRENKVSGWENHLWLVSSSDFNGDYTKYQKELQGLVNTAQKRLPYPAEETRLAYIGVPSVYAKELYQYIEKHGARVVFNEVQRQFSMPARHSSGGATARTALHSSGRVAAGAEPGANLAEQYSNYTYPYSLQERLKDIKTQVEKRRIDGVIHYVQAFCHRGIGDIVFRESIGLPVLTLEGNADFYLSGHVKTRIEAFLDMIERKKNKG